MTWFPAHLYWNKFSGKILIVFHIISIWNSLTSDVRKALSSLPTVWASVGVFFVFIQAGFAVDSPTAHHLVGSTGHSLTDLTHQLVWWSFHKLAVIATNCGSTRSHLLRMKRCCVYILYTLEKQEDFQWWHLTHSLISQLTYHYFVGIRTQQLIILFWFYSSIKMGTVTCFNFTWGPNLVLVAEIQGHMLPINICNDVFTVCQWILTFSTWLLALC